MANIFRSESFKPLDRGLPEQEPPRSILGNYAGRIGRKVITQDMIGEPIDAPDPEPAAPAPKGWGTTVKEGFVTGIERAGAGLSGVLGRSPETIAGDLADVQQYPQSAEETAFDIETARRAQAFDDAKGFADSAGAAIDILGLMVKNPKLASKKIAESLGSSLPAYGGATGGAIAGGMAAGPVGSVIGGLVGYLAGNLATNVQAEMEGKLEADMAARGIDTKDPGRVEQAIRSEPNLIPDARSYAIKKGGATTAAESAVDVATLGAAKFLKPAKSLLRTAGRGGAVVAGQGVAEGAGSMAGSAAVGEDVSVGQAITEGLYGAAAGAPEGAAIFHGGRRLQGPGGRHIPGAEDLPEPQESAPPATPLLPAPPAQQVDWELVDDRPQLPPPGGPGGAPALGFEPTQTEPMIIVDPRGNAMQAPERFTRDAQARRQESADLGLTPDVRAAQAARSAPAEASPAIRSMPAEDLLADSSRSQSIEVAMTPDAQQVQLARLGVEPTDLISKFGHPFMLQSSAQAEADRIGGTVVAIPDGFVVRPERRDAGSRRNGAAVEPTVGAAVLQRPAGLPGGQGIPARARQPGGDGVLDVPGLGTDAVSGATLPGHGAAPDAGGVRPRGSASAVAHKARRQRFVASNPFLAFLAEHGVNLSEQKAITGETGRRGNRMVPYFGPIFRRAGLPLDVLAQYAHERGFLTDAQFNSDLDNGGVNALTEMIRRTQAGERIDSAAPASEESEFERRAQAYHDAHAEAVDTLDAEATDEELGALVLEVTDEDETATAAAIDAALGLGPQGEDRGGAQEAPAVAAPIGDSGSRTPARSAGPAEVDEARAEREAIQAEAADLESGIDLDEVNALLSEAADADRSIRDETLDRILREERGEEEAHVRGAQGDDAGPQIRGSEGDQADQGGEDVLSRPTEQGLKARADAALRRAKEKRERDAAPPPEEFTPAGSDRAVNQAAARGQMELAPADAAAAQSPSSPSNNLPAPSEAQHEAGNYLKPPARINGLTVRIENEAGTHRRPEWPALPAHYGYVERSEGADGDGVDVFVKPGTPEDFDGPVFIIDQVKQGGGFDEHKIMLGWKTHFGAVRDYKRAYTKGWKVGPVTRMSMDEFKAWLRDADTTKPASRQIAKKRADKPTKPTGAWVLAQRQENAGERFIQAVIEQFGLTREQAKAALDELVRVRSVKLDAHSGQFELRDGRFWDAEVMRRAAETNYKGKEEATRDGQPVGRDEPLTIGEIPNTGDFEADTTKYLTEVLPETFTLYRSVWIGNGEKPNLDDPGSYWAETPEGARRSGFPPTGQKNRQVILDVRASRSDIDVRQSIARRRQYGEPEIVLKSPPGKARVFALPTGGQPIGSDGLTDTERESNRLDGIADELAMQVQQESSERDFAPSEIPAVIEQWAKDNKVDAGELRTRVVDRLRKRLSEGRMRQVEQAFDREEPAAPAKLAAMPAIGEIDRGLATQAFEGTSHTPDRRGESARSEYVRLLRDAWNEAVEIAGDDPAAIDRIRDEFEKLRDGYRRRYEAYLRTHSRVMSSMIVGPARFPTERNRKRMDAADKRAEEANEFLRKGIARLKKAARAPIDNTPTGELERIRANLAERERAQEQMKAANAALRKGDDAALREMGFTDEAITELKKPDFAGRAGFPSYRLTNNQSEIRRLRERLAQAEGRVETAAAGPTSQQVGGARIEEDAEANRIRLFFDGKPDEATRAALKKAGFRWAPSVGAWQRQLTGNARAAARSILGLDGETDQGIALHEPTARYSVHEPQRPTQQIELPLAEGGSASSGRPGLPGPDNRARRGTVQRVEAATEVRLATTPDPQGVYLARTELVAERHRTIHADRVTSPQEAAVALASVADYAVEHFQGLVTDKAGKPLALVGMFKGAVAETRVYAETIYAEAFRVKGAANIWFTHNHPSGKAEFSSADRTMYTILRNALQGTGIEPRGIFAQTYSKGAKTPGAWVFTDGQDNIRGQVLATDTEAANKVAVPVVERVIVKQESNSAIRSSADAKDAARAMQATLGTDAPFVMLLSSQNEPIGAYPLKLGELAVLREGERAANLLRATSVANASGSILVDVQAALTDAELNNVAGALSVATGARPLDALTGKNLAARTESGRWDPPHGTFFSRRQSTKADYESRIDELFSGEPANRIGAKVLDRSDLLALLGFGDKAMRLQESKVIAGRENHRLTAEHWKKVPEWLENPVAVFDSETVLGRLVFIAPEMLNGDPIIMIVEPDAEVGVVRVGLLVNAYDRQAAHTPIKRWLKAGLLRYLDESRSPTWGGTSGLRLPRVNRPSQGSKAIVRTNRDLVKFREGEGQTRFLRRVDAALRSVQDRSDETPADTERSRGDRQRNRIGRDALHRINEHLRAARAPDQDAVADLKDALRARGADPGIDALRASTVPDAARAIAGVLERLFGVKAIFVDGAENLTAENQFDGMYIGGRRVFISSSATKPFHQVIGHEFLHHLKRTNRDLYDEFVEAVQPFVLARRAQAYAQARGEEYSGLAEAVRTETGWEETFADAWGDAWNEPTFWRSLAASNHGLFKTIAAKWRLFVLSIRMALAGERGRALTKGLFTDFDVVRDVIADVAGRAGRAEGQSTVGQTMLRSPPQSNDAFVSEALAELAAHDELFRYPTSKSTTLDGVMADVFPEAQYLGEDTRPDERQESGADARHVIRGANGKMAYIFERGKEVWLDISRFQEGDRGDGVYAAAMNYAHNAGKRFIGDPAGLSEAAIVRRTSAMLSNALRFGTTKHMDAAPEQIAGVPEKGIAPLKWQGDDLAKTTALIDSFLSTLYTQFPVLKGYRYDFRKGQFLDRSGRPVGPDRFAVAGRREVARRAKAGSATARRGIFLQSLVSSESGQRPELLEHILRRGRALTSEGGPARAMFSRRASAATAANESVLKRAQAALARVREARQRAGLGELSSEQEAALRNVGGIAAAKTLSERVHEIRANLKTKLVQGLVDQFAPLKDLDPRAYVLSRLSRGADGTLEAAMLFGKPFLNGGVADVKMDGGFAKTLSALEGEHDRFLWWVAAQRAERLKAIGLENLFGETDIATLKGLDRGTLASGKPRAAAFAKALDDLNAFNDAVLGIAEKSGLIDAETRKMFKDSPYVPFYRVMDEDGGVRGIRGSNGLVNQRAWHKLKGGSQKLSNDLLSNLLMNWSHLFTASARNRAAVTALSAAHRAGVAHEVAAGTKGAVRVTEAGKQTHFVVDDPYLMQAISAIEYASPSWFKPFSAFKRWLTIGVTANPAFKVRNLIRDSLSAIGQAELSFNPLANVAQGWQASGKTTQTFASMLASGGIIRFGTMIEGDRSHAARSLIRQAGHQVLDKAGWKRLGAMLGDAVEAYNELGDRSENANRAALYEQLRAKGYSMEDAAFAARDLLDFSMSGTWPVVRFLTQTVPFLNARLQGLYKLGRAAHENPRRFGYVAGAVSLASLALLLAYQDDDDWKAREDWDRDTYWWFKIGNTAFRIPKPFEIGAIGTLAERSWELAFDKEMSVRRYGARLSDMMANTFAMDPTPQIVKPIVDIWANKDSFTGRPIETSTLERLRPEDRYDERTTTIARTLGAMGLPNPASLAKGDYNPLSPKQIDFLIRGYAGWLGTTLATIPDYGLRPLQERGDRPAMRLRDVFLAGNFVETLPAGSSRYVTAMYEQAREAEQAYASFRDALKRGDREGAEQIRIEEGEKLQMAGGFRAATQGVGKIGQRIKQIEADRKMSGDEKRTEITRLEQLRAQVARQAVERAAR